MNLGIYYKWSKSDDFIITKCKFMTVLADVYNIIIRRDAAYVSSLIRRYDSVLIGKEDFKDLILSLDSTIDGKGIEWLYKKG